MKQAETFDAWSRVLTAGAGTIVETNEDADFIIVNEEEVCDLEEYEGQVVVETSWVSQCLILQTVIDPTEYLRVEDEAPVKVAVMPERKAKERRASSSSSSVKEKPSSTRRSTRKRK
jgi:hypothetical protein